MNVKKVPCDPRRRHKNTLVQFLRDQEIGVKVIKDDNDDEKKYWFGWLADETVHIDFEERF